MNSSRVTQLVKHYKCITGDCKSSRILKNALIKNILKEYEIILNSMISSINIDRDEIISLFNYYLMYCINNYDVSKNIAFNTYFFYHVRSIRRRIFESAYDTLSSNEDLENVREIELIDLTIDLPKILTSEEILILNVFYNGKSDRRGSKLLTKRLDIIYNKIKDYINA